MTLLNIHIKDKEKKKLQKYVETHTDKSMSEFVRNLIAQKMKIEEILSTIPDPGSPKIPDYVPKNQYIIFVKGAVVAVGEKPCELAQIARQKFPNLPFVIKFNGPKPKPLEYFYMSLSNLQGWKYSKFEDRSYPIIPITFQSNNEKLETNASFDTAASLCILKDSLFPPEKLILSRKGKISTAAGIIDTMIYKGLVSILDANFEIEFIIAPLADILPFEFLIGRNMFDQLDAFFLGKKQTTFLKLAE